MKKSSKILKGFAIFAMTLFMFDSVMANLPSRQLFVDGKKVDAEIKVIDNVTYVPLSALSNSTGMDVKTTDNAIEVTLPAKSNDDLVPGIIQKISPSVVGIIGNYSVASSSYQDKYAEYTAHGTGVIIKSGGEILTNAHVVKGLKNIIVILSDGSAYSAKLKNIDEKSDLAVIKIDKQGLPIVTFGSMDTVVAGKSVVAIGNPLSFSLRNSASMGIISGLNRGLSSDYALIQTDASINPGNSGGPLVNMAGEVIGINSSKLVAVGIEGMGFAIPVDTVQYVLSHFEKYGAVVRPQLGIEFEESWAARRGLPTKGGLLVKKVTPNSSAAKVGILNGDSIMSIDGVKINSIVDLNECLKKYLPGTTSKLSVTRNGQTIEVSITY